MVNLGHCVLWVMVIWHVDINVAGMMWDNCKEKAVLSDFDLTKTSKSKLTCQNDIKGTLPFIALDLLTVEGMTDEIAPLYRHELASFTWGFIYLLLYACEARKRDLRLE